MLSPQAATRMHFFHIQGSGLDLSYLWRRTLWSCVFQWWRMQILENWVPNNNRKMGSKISPYAFRMVQREWKFPRWFESGFKFKECQSMLTYFFDVKFFQFGVSKGRSRAWVLGFRVLCMTIAGWHESGELGFRVLYGWSWTCISQLGYHEFPIYLLFKASHSGRPRSQIWFFHACILPNCLKLQKM